MRVDLKRRSWHLSTHLPLEMQQANKRSVNITSFISSVTNQKLFHGNRFFVTEIRQGIAVYQFS